MTDNESMQSGDSSDGEISEVEVTDGGPMLPDFGTIAELLVGKSNGYYQDEDAVTFLYAVAKVLGNSECKDWKDLSSDYPLEDEYNKSKSQKDETASVLAKRAACVSFAKIGREMNEMLKKQKRPGNVMVKLDTFRHGRAGIAKYFNQRLVKNLQAISKNMRDFSIVLSGFICKLYFSKEGYDASFADLQKDVGSFIAENGIKASQEYEEFRYRLVIPQDIGFLYSSSAVLDTDKELLRPHCIRQDRSSDEVIPLESKEKPRKLPKMITEAPVPKTYEARIQENNEKLCQLESDVANLNNQINDRLAQMDSLRSENESLIKLHQQEINNKDLVDKMREFASEESVFVEVSDIVVDVMPSLVKVVPKVDISVVKMAFLNAINSLVLDIEAPSLNATDIASTVQNGSDAKEQEDSEKRAKEEEEKKAKEEAEKRAKKEADSRAKQEADERKKKEAEKKAKEKAEQRAKEEAEKKKKEEAEKKAKEKAEQRAKEEAEKKKKEETEKKAKQKAEQRAKEEDEKRNKDEAERKAKEKVEQKAQDKAANLAKNKANKQVEQVAELIIAEDVTIGKTKSGDTAAAKKNADGSAASNKKPEDGAVGKEKAEGTKAKDSQTKSDKSNKRNAGGQGNASEDEESDSSTTSTTKEPAAKKKRQDNPLLTAFPMASNLRSKTNKLQELAGKK